MEEKNFFNFERNVEEKKEFFQKKEIEVSENLQKTIEENTFKESEEKVEKKLTTTEEKMKRKKGMKIPIFQLDSNKGLYNGILNSNSKNEKTVFLISNNTDKNYKEKNLNLEKMLSNIEEKKIVNLNKGPTRD